MVLSCFTFNAKGLMDMGKCEKQRVKEKCKGEDGIALQETLIRWGFFCFILSYGFENCDL